MTEACKKMEIRGVPDDHLLEPRHRFNKPSLKHVQECFGGIHEQSERNYHGGGVWGERDPRRIASLPVACRPQNMSDGNCPPLYRNTAWRIIGYANALKAEENDLYRERMQAGGEYLLKEQQANGSFLYFRKRADGWPNSHHLLLCSANPGCGFIELYRLCGDRRYLDASGRAAEWSSGFAVSHNANYNSFAVWHQCEHYRETHDKKYLESSLEKTVKGVYPGQLANGAWSGHNSWIFYHAVIVRGMAALYGVLPDGHKEKAELRRRMIMAVNHIIEEQAENGCVRSCFDAEEWRKSRDPASAYSVHAFEKICPWTMHALVCVQEWTDLNVSNTLYGLLSAPPQDELAAGQEGMMHLGYGVAYRFCSV